MPESHTDLYDVRKLEEEERKRRIQEMGAPEQHYISRREAREIEERERQRRIREDSDDFRQRAMREARMIERARELEDLRSREEAFQPKNASERKIERMNLEE